MARKEKHAIKFALKRLGPISSAILLLLLLVIAALIYTRPMTVEQLCPGLDFSKCVQVSSHYFPTDISKDVKVVTVSLGEPEYLEFIDLFREHKFRRSLNTLLPMNGNYGNVVDTDGSTWYAAFYFRDVEFPDGTVQSGRLLDCQNYGNQRLTLGLCYQEVPAMVMGEHSWLREVLELVQKVQEEEEPVRLSELYRVKLEVQDYMKNQEEGTYYLTGCGHDSIKMRVIVGIDELTEESQRWFVENVTDSELVILEQKEKGCDVLTDVS